MSVRLFHFCTEKPARDGPSANELTGVTMPTLTPVANKNKPLPPAPSAPWEIALISYLLAAVEARDARIAYFEAEDRRKAREIDRERRRGG
jgi:hypothetical protein